MLCLFALRRCVCRGFTMFAEWIKCLRGSDSEWYSSTDGESSKEEFVEGKNIFRLKRWIWETDMCFPAFRRVSAPLILWLHWRRTVKSSTNNIVTEVWRMKSTKCGTFTPMLVSSFSCVAHNHIVWVGFSVCAVNDILCPQTFALREKNLPRKQKNLERNLRKEGSTK